MNITARLLSVSRRARLKTVSRLLRRAGVSHVTVFDPNHRRGAVILSSCLWKDETLDLAIDRTCGVAEFEIPEHLVSPVLNLNYDWQDTR